MLRTTICKRSAPGLELLVYGTTLDPTNPPPSLVASTSMAYTVLGHAQD